MHDKSPIEFHRQLINLRKDESRLQGAARHLRASVKRSSRFRIELDGR
jgi:hypothetical protein